MRDIHTILQELDEKEMEGKSLQVTDEEREALGINTYEDDLEEE